MTYPPPGTPSSHCFQPLVVTPSRTEDKKFKFDNLPERLVFFVKPDLDLDSKWTTETLIAEIIKYFDPNVNVTKHMTKPSLKCMFYEHVSPIIRKYGATSNSATLTPPPTPSRTTSLLRFEEYAHAFHPSFDPKHRHSTKKILQAEILHKSPKQTMSPQITKTALVDLFERHIHKAPAPHREFSGIPALLASSKLQGQTCDELRFALQAHIPTLFIKSHVRKPGLVNIYRRFILGEPESQNDCAEAQLDFFMFKNQSL